MLEYLCRRSIGSRRSLVLSHPLSHLIESSFMNGSQLERRRRLAIAFAERLVSLASSSCREICLCRPKSIVGPPWYRSLWFSPIRAMVAWKEREFVGQSAVIARLHLAHSIGVQHGGHCLCKKEALAILCLVFLVGAAPPMDVTELSNPSTDRVGGRVGIVLSRLSGNTVEFRYTATGMLLGLGFPHKINERNSGEEGVVAMEI